jgi:hypothetical protein
VGLALPKTAVARLIGHDGPVQTLRFTGKLLFSCFLFCFPKDENISRAWTERLHSVAIDDTDRNIFLHFELMG